MSGSHDLPDEFFGLDQPQEAELERELRGPEATHRQRQAAQRRALDRGVSFHPLRSVGHGSDVIEGLEEIEKLSREQLREEDAEISRALQEEAGGATAWRDDELEGFGSSAGYSTRVEDEDVEW